MQGFQYRYLCLLFCLSLSLFAKAQLPEDFYDQLFADGYTFPTHLEFDGNGQLYISSKPGRIFVIDSSGAKVDKPLIDISEEVSDWSDHGLMSFALDPDFLNNGYIYLLYAVDLHHLRYYGTPQYNPDSTVIWEPTIGRVTRYQANPSTQFTTIIEDSRKVLLGEDIYTGIPLMYEFHGLGTILAALDGTLLISTGDATSNASVDIGGDSIGTFASRAIELGIIPPDADVGSYKSQYLGTYSGKILRIDAQTGDGLASNPFYDEGNPRSSWSRTWAYGFRNPYRIALKPETGSHYAADGDPGTIYVGDVGNGAWEELNIVTEGGQNFGWPIIEGVDLNWSFWISDVPDNHRAPNPLFQVGNCDQPFFNFRELFVRENARQSIIPSNQCSNNEQIPEALYTRETLPVIAWSNSRWNPPARAILPGVSENSGGPTPLEVSAPESWVESEGFAGYSSLAGIYYTEGAYPENYHNTYFAVDFSGWIKIFRFDEKDQLTAVENFHNGAKDIIHLASDPKNGNLFYINLAGEIRTITYGGNPPPNAIIESDLNYGVGPLTVQFDASKSTDSNLPIVDYLWDFGDGDTSRAIQTQHTFKAASDQPESFTVRLTVTDSLGASASTTRIISLNNTPPQVDIISFEDGDQYPIDATSLLLLEAEIKDLEHTNDELFYEWRVYLHHNDHYHPEPATYDAKTFTLISPLGCKNELYWYRIELSVTDPAGLKTQLTQNIYPYCGEAFLESTALSGEANGEVIDLSWTSALEDAVLKYELQKSQDFFNFETIASFAPQGNQSTYQFTDETPFLGNNIYRVKRISSERAYNFSNMLSVAYPAPIALQVLPNPATNFYVIQVEEVSNDAVAFELFDQAGRQLLNTSWEAPSGQGFEKRLLTTNLPSGTYFYRIKSGKQRSAGKLVVNK